jgi:hypothetical protein
MGKRTSKQNLEVLNFVEVDAANNLVPGSAEIHLEAAARRWNYVPYKKGSRTIKFAKERSDDDEIPF